MSNAPKCPLCRNSMKAGIHGVGACIATLLQLDHYRVDRVINQRKGEKGYWIIELDAKNDLNAYFFNDREKACGYIAENGNKSILLNVESVPSRPAVNVAVDYYT